MKTNDAFEYSGKRRLKVYSKSFPRANSKYKTLPEIQLSGKWLEAIGFKCGETVTVETENGRIVISLTSQPEKVGLQARPFTNRFDESEWTW